LQILNGYEVLDVAFAETVENYVNNTDFLIFLEMLVDVLMKRDPKFHVKNSYIYVGFLARNIF
jgi:hypothetical protein